MPRLCPGPSRNRDPFPRLRFPQRIARFPAYPEGGPWFPNLLTLNRVLTAALDLG